MTLSLLIILAKIILFAWAFVTAYCVTDILLPLFLARREEKQWQRNHPDLPLWRRGSRF
jgi:hypothetical protein